MRTLVLLVFLSGCMPYAPYAEPQRPTTEGRLICRRDYLLVAYDSGWIDGLWTAHDSGKWTAWSVRHGSRGSYTPRRGEACLAEQRHTLK